MGRLNLNSTIINLNDKVETVKVNNNYSMCIDRSSIRYHVYEKEKMMRR